MRALAQGNKPDTKRQKLFDSTHRRYPDGKFRDPASPIVDTGGGGGGGESESHLGEITKFWGWGRMVGTIAQNSVTELCT